MGAIEVLTLLSGVITIGGFLTLPEITQSFRLRGAVLGAFFMAYAVWAASQSSGIILIPTGAFACAGIVLFMLYMCFASQEEE